MGSLEDFWITGVLVKFLLLTPLLAMAISEYVKRRKRMSKNVLEGDRAFIYLIIAGSFVLSTRLYELLSKDSGFFVLSSRIIVSFFILFYFIKMVSKVGGHVDKKFLFFTAVIGIFYIISEVTLRVTGDNDLFETGVSFIALFIIVLFNFVVVKYLINTKGVSV